MIQDLDNTIKKLLEQELLPHLTEQVAISFATPDEDFSSAVTFPAYDLFLYDVRENRDLRSGSPVMALNGSGNYTKQMPPARLDCSYLITAWSEFKPDPSEQEHMLLGEIAKVLLRHPVLPEAVLQGELAGQDPPLPTAVLQPGRLQSLAEFWQALGGKPKAALNFMVTISVPTLEPQDAGPPVTDSKV